MKKFKAKFMSNVASVCMIAAACAFCWGSKACFLYFYEPEQPENMENVSAKDLTDLLHK